MLSRMLARGGVGRETGIERRRLGAPVDRDHLLGGFGAALLRSPRRCPTRLRRRRRRSRPRSARSSRRAARATARGSSSSCGCPSVRGQCIGAAAHIDRRLWFSRYTHPKPVNRWPLRTVYATTTLATLFALLAGQPAWAHVDVQPRLVERGAATELRIELPQLRPGPAPQRLELEGSELEVLSTRRQAIVGVETRLDVPGSGRKRSQARCRSCSGRSSPTASPSRWRT